MTNFNSPRSAELQSNRFWVFARKYRVLWITFIFGLLGCEIEPQRSVELPKGMRRMGDSNMARPTGLAGGGTEILSVVSFRWSVQPKSGQLNECASRYSEAMLDILSVSDPRRLNQLLIDTGYHVGDLESEFGTTRFETDRKIISEIYWEQACAFASLGHFEDAVEALLRSIDRGMIDSNRIRNSSWLSELREHQDLSPIIRKCEHALEEQIDRVIGESLVTQPLYVATELLNLDGNRFEFGSSDQEWTMIYCWATWSRPSLEMLPVVNQIAQDSQFKRVRVVGVLAEPANTANPNVLKLLLKKHPTEFPNLLEDSGNAQRSSFLSILLPTIMVVDARAQILARLEGYQPIAVVDALLSRLANPSNVTKY